MSKKKIYLSPSDQTKNMYAGGLGTEQQHCTEIAKCAKIALEAHGFEVKIGDNHRDELYPQRVAESNSWGADMHIPIHTNASNGSTQGTLVMCYSTSEADKKPAQAVYNALVQVVPSRSGLGVRARQDLYEINSTNATCVYVECDFHDNPDVAAWIVGNHKTLGEAICKGVCDYYGVPYNGSSDTPTPTPQPPAQTAEINAYYRVRTQAHGWLPEVKNNDDFAGFQGSPITDVAIRVDRGSVKYRVHVLGEGWLPYVTGCNINDYQNGFAGEGKVIDAIEIYFFTPDDIRPCQKAMYRANNFSWQYDNEKCQGQDGYAGLFGVPITELRLCIK